MTPDQTYTRCSQISDQKMMENMMIYGWSKKGALCVFNPLPEKAIIKRIIKEHKLYKNIRFPKKWLWNNMSVCHRCHHYRGSYPNPFAKDEPK